MYIEKRTYKFNASRKEVDHFISRFDENSSLSAMWTAEHTFCVQKRRSSLFKLEGNTDELESSHKLKIAIRTDYRYPLLYIIPVAAILTGIILWIAKNSELGQLMVFGGFFGYGLIYLITASVIDRLKKRFKEEFQII